MVDMLTFALGYLALAAVMIALLLFGESPMLRGTPVAWGHWLITEGVWMGLERLLVLVCGRRVQGWIEAVLECCCDRPNHTLQISYVGLLAVGYWMYWTNLFALLPNKWVGEAHIITGSASLLVCCATFVWACRSDPGFVTGDTWAVHSAMYPCDGAVWCEKTCATCRWSRPARSKHCRVCRGCVARHDHHCGWINNCVGLLNHRVFLLFLVSNLVMTVYGSVLGVLIMLGQADQMGMLRHKFLDYRTGGVKVVYLPTSRVFEWLVFVAPLPMALTLFMAAAALLVTLFLGYQISLICQGTTQYEVYRWRHLHMILSQAAQAEQAVVSGQEQDLPGGVGQTVARSQSEGKGGGKAEAGSSSVASGVRSRAGAGKSKGDASKMCAVTSAGDLPDGHKQGEGSSTSSTGKGTIGSAVPDKARGQGLLSSRGLIGRFLLWLGRRVGWLPPRGGRRVKIELPENRYHNGLIGNFSEVLFPYYHLQKHSKRL